MKLSDLDIPATYIPRATVPATNRAWGDREAEAAGLYETGPTMKASQRQNMAALPPGFELIPDEPQGGGAALPEGFELIDDDGPTFNERFAGEPVEPKRSPSIMDAVTDIPREVGSAFSENLGALKSGLTDRGSKGPIDGLLSTGKAVLAIPGMALSPITGAARSLIGHPMAQAEHAIGALINPEVAARDNPQRMYEAAKGDVDLAMSAMGSRGRPAVSTAPSAPPRVGSELASAADRLGVDVPRAVASDSIAVQRLGQGIRNIPVVGDRIPRATQQLSADLGTAVQRTADEFGQGSGQNVAHRVGNTIASAAEAETAAATRAARQTDEAATAAWEAANTGRAQALDATDAQALQKARQAVGDMSPQDMGQAITARLRAGEQAARARKEELYKAAGESEASIEAGAARGAVSRVAQSLENEGIVVDPVLTPVASRMFDEVRKLGELRNPNKAVGARPPAFGDEQIAAISIQGIERTRKVLNFLRQGAANDADRRAASGVVREFDRWLDDAVDNALFSGSDEALSAIKSARKANAEWRSRFFNTKDDAGKVINKIVTGEVTPQEVSNWLIGASKVGASGVSSRLLTRIAEVTGGDAQAMQAIRGGVWNRLSQSTGGVDAKAGPKVANDVYEFLNGSGRDIANRLFTPEQRGIMKAYADTVRSTAAQREALPSVAKASKPTPTEVGIGPMQELANTVLGRNGRTDEALFAAINSYAKSGGRGDIQTLARLVKALPEPDRGDLAGSIIRQIGISPRTGQFSPDVFASQWQTYTPQAKTLLFGNAGPHRQALDDIMTISQRMKQIGNRFGNPSGTAQNANIFAMGAGAMAAPLTTLTAALGGAAVARILASPAAASSASKWSRAYFAVQMKPTAHTIAAYNTASRNLSNTAAISDSRQDAGSSGFALPFPLSSADRGQTAAPLGAIGLPKTE